MAADRRVLFFGDSFVADVGDPTGLGWVGRGGGGCARRRAIPDGLQPGVRRDTSADVAARWEAEARPRMGAADASYGIVFAVGTNDMTEEDGRLRVEPEAAVDNLDRMIERARADGPDVFVVGRPPAGERGQDERVRALSMHFADLARDRGVPFVETAPLRTSAAWMREAARNDGSHPGTCGYSALAEIVLAGGWVDWVR